jgi:dynein heavy chain
MKQFDDTVLVAAASPPGGGRSPLTPRFSRHFLIYNIHKSSEESLTLIFSTILNGFLNAYKFKPDIIMIGE